jgi:acyl-CoA synthetase (NDP forming)
MRRQSSRNKMSEMYRQSQEPSGSADQGSAAALDCLFAPRSIAVIGASSNSRKQAGLPVLNLLRHAYPGAIYPVNPNQVEVMGLKSYPSMASIGQPVDLTLIMTPADQVLAAVLQGVQAGSKAFIVYASGFAEQDAVGRDRQTELTALARAHHVIVVGPNCNGMINAHASVCATIASVSLPELRLGGLSFVGQSGAMAAYWLQLLTDAGCGFGKWIATGNEADLSLAEVVHYFASDPLTKVICVYLEAARDGIRLRQAFEAARAAGKPVFAIRSGRSEQGARAAQSHTGAIAGEGRVWNGLFAQTGVIEFDSLTQMIDAARLVQTEPRRIRGNPLLMSISGGAGSMMVDAIDAAKMAPAILCERTLAVLADALPAYGTPANPLDLTGSMAVQPDIFTRTCAALETCEDFDSIIICLGMLGSIHMTLIDAMVRHLKPSGKPIVVAWLAATPETRSAMSMAGMPCYPDIPQAVHALAVWRTISEQTPRPPLPAVKFTTRPDKGHFISEYRGQAALGQIPGLTWPRAHLVANANEIDQKPDGMTQPVVLKLQSAAMPHKTEHGGIVLGLKNRDALRAACEKMMSIATRLGIATDGYLIQQMVDHEHEMLVGLRNDPNFGPILVLGRGGTEAESDPDVCIRVLPVSVDEIESALRSLRLAQRLQGTRGRQGVVLSELAACIKRLSQIYFERADLIEIEINPLGISAPDRFTALDLLVTTAESGSTL